ncbi:hypothetical protein QTL95_26850 [Rhizobium sp. S152]|uniref:hypothetical protein n=1 Tax=Rhizobium sp. S152 TaxID=3055038 RepID=UPI0025A98454|nr:hypothetical protein [Rhizobium sp. S152]MDM9629508.1 hypothetical protein [Rhizobium sp. S152]
MSIVRHFDRLCAIRDSLEARLELHEARYCLGDEEIDDGSGRDLRERLAEIAEEIHALAHRPLEFAF